MTEWQDMALRIGLAALSGVVLGANRWIHHKSAGVKTHGLVAIGSALAVLCVWPAGAEGAVVPALPTDAVSRVIQGLITGIGFLGAGVIMRDPRGTRVQGLTTAASIWITAIVGAAFGAGHVALGLVAVGSAGVVLILGNQIEAWVGGRFGDRAAPGKDQGKP